MWTPTTASTTYRYWRTSPLWSATAPAPGRSPYRATREGALDLNAVAHAQQHTPDHPGIVNGSIAAAVQAAFGDIRLTDRTRDSEVFVDPLTSLYFAFDLPGPASRCMCLDRIGGTCLMRRVPCPMEEFRETTVTRPPRDLPH